VLGGPKPILRPILVSDVRKSLQISHETAQKIKSEEISISPFIPCICEYLSGTKGQRGHLAAPLGLSRAQLALFSTSGHWRGTKKRHVRASSGLFWPIERDVPTDQGIFMASKTMPRPSAWAYRAPAMGPNALPGRRSWVGCRGPNCDRNRKGCCFGGDLNPRPPGESDLAWARGICIRKTTT
jgi:hypothetical protein